MTDPFECPECGHPNYGNPDHEIALTLYIPTTAARYIDGIVQAHKAALDNTPFAVVNLAPTPEPIADDEGNHYLEWDDTEAAGWGISLNLHTHTFAIDPTEIGINQLGHFIGAATAAWNAAHQKATTQ